MHGYLHIACKHPLNPFTLSSMLQQNLLVTC